jgi:hypothetical protein
MGEVYSVFSKALNIKTKENELISIVAAEKLNGPNRTLIELPANEDFISLGIKEGMRVIGDEQEIRIDRGRLSISLEKAERWLPGIKREGGIPGSRIKDNLLSLKKSLLIERKKDRISQELESRTQELIKTIKKKDLSKVSKNVKGLIGFGEGLTPSGDDFLVGLIASLHFLGDSRFEHFLKKIKEAVELGKERTTFISRKFLEYACQGRFPETVLNLIEAILFGDKEEVKEANKRCLDFGATSGRDTLLGVVKGLGLIVQVDSQ